MFCINCGQEIGTGMAFCPRCGASVGQQPSAAKKNPSRKGLVYALVFAVIAVIVLLSALVFVLWGGDNGRTERRDDVAITEKEETTDEEKPQASLEQILIAESVRAARQIGAMSGSMEYIEAMGTPHECVNYIRQLAAFDDEPLAVYMNMQGAVPQEFVSAYYLTGGNEGMLLASLPNVLNGRYIGNAVLAAYSIVSTSHCVSLPEPLEEPAIFLLGFENSYDYAFVTFIPVGGKLAQVSCTPVSGGVIERVDLREWLDMPAVSDTKVEKAIKAAQGVSLAASRAFGRVDAQWCWTQANAAVRRLGYGKTPQAFEYFTDDEEVMAICCACADAAIPNWNFHADASTEQRMEACNAAVYTLDAEKLTAFYSDNAQVIEQFWDILRPRAASAFTNSLLNPYGTSYIAAGAILNRAAAMLDPEGAQPQRLPMGFDSENIYIVYQELENGFCAVTALYDAGNNILGTSTCILPDNTVFSDVIDSALGQGVYRLD